LSRHQQRVAARKAIGENENKSNSLNADAGKIDAALFNLSTAPIARKMGFIDLLQIADLGEMFEDNFEENKGGIVCVGPEIRLCAGFFPSIVPIA
jgi:hypothetical protein